MGPYRTSAGASVHDGRRLIPLLTCPCIGLFLALLLSFSSAAQCVSPSMVFASPTLISGVNGQIGAIYRFSNVATGIDATIEIRDLVGGAGLNTMDNTTQGYYNAWQPYVTAGANDTSYLDWKIVFKKAGTNTDTLLPCLSITAVDIDGDGSKLKEFIKASTPGAYAVDPFTYLSVYFDGVNSSAIGVLSTVPSIDTAAKKYMFQMDFRNVSTIYYRNGSISTKSTTDVRHTCIYFKSFFASGLIYLPVHIVSFQGRPATQGVQLQWIAEEEDHQQHYTVQKSRDGRSWQNAGRVNVKPPGVGANSYSFCDKELMSGTLYYRLEAMDRDERTSYSSTVSVHVTGGQLVVNCLGITGKSIPVELISPSTQAYHFSVYQLQGQELSRRSFTARTGVNRLQLELPAYSAAGIYVLVVTDQQGVVVYRKRLLLQ